MIYLKNILLIGVQNELKGLIPHGIHIIIEMFRSLPAIRGRWDEQLHIGIWSVNYRPKQMFKLHKTQVWVVIIHTIRWNHIAPHGLWQKNIQLYKLHKYNDMNDTMILTISQKETDIMLLRGEENSLEQTEWHRDMYISTRQW